MRRYGRFATLDLASGAAGELTLPEAEARRWLGGGGIGARLFYDRGPDSVVIANGLLTGLPVTTACKTSILFRSPLTGILGESSVGGTFGAMLVRTGFDGLVLEGRSERPVWLLLTEEGARVHEAAALRGLETPEAHAAIAALAPAGSRIGVIGPAGERGVAFASVMFGGRHPRAAGRCGVGCRFGRMGIKGIAVRGDRKAEPADRDGLRSFSREFGQAARQRAAGLRLFGTANGVLKREVSGDLPVRNFGSRRWQGADRISGQTYREMMHRRDLACFMCPIACGKAIAPGGPDSTEEVSQPEYESAGALGSNLMIADPVALAHLNDRCNRLGLDTISAGVAIGFLFECLERGLVEAAACGLGSGPWWGDSEVAGRVLGLIAARSGVGELLAGGVRAAAASIGGGSERFAIHAKGLELPMHDPRAYVSAGATYATGNRGGAHGEALAYYLEEGMSIGGMGFPEKIDPHASADKGAIVARMQDLCALFDSLGMCKFLLAGGVTPDDLARFTRLATGWDTGPGELLEAGARAYTLKRMRNQRLGVDRTQDTLPARILEEPHLSGSAAGVLPDLPLMLDELYAARGWDGAGRVTRETAVRFGLEEEM